MAMIDGREVKRFIFCYYSNLLRRNFPAEVHAFSIDHAVQRLRQHLANVNWEFVCELQGDETLGKMGPKLELNPTVLRNETN